MAGCKVLWVSNSYNFEYTYVQSQDIVTPGSYYLPLADLTPHLLIAAAKSFPEIVQEVQQSKGHQEVCNLLVPRVP